MQTTTQNDAVRTGNGNMRSDDYHQSDSKISVPSAEAVAVYASNPLLVSKHNTAGGFTEGVGEGARDGVRLSHIIYRYGKRPVLRDVTLDLDRPGRVIGLFGPNGAGKTTVIRIAAGLINRFEGRRTFGASGPMTQESNRNTDASAVPRKQRQSRATVRPVDPAYAVAYLPDVPFLYPTMSLDDALKVFASRYPDFRPQVARDALGGLGFHDFGLRVGQCSKGMGEQVHICLTLARKPALYAFDEPLAAVDPATRRKIMALIGRYRSPKATMLVSTHLIDDVSGLFDDVVILDKGRIRFDGTVDELTENRAKDMEEVFIERMGE